MRTCVAAGILLSWSATALAQQPAQESLSPTHCEHWWRCHQPPPPPPPLTLSIRFDPAQPSILDNAPIASPITVVKVIRSDGQPFTGSLGFGMPYGSDNGVCAIQGTEVILGAVPPDGIQNCTVTATQ